MPLSDSCVGYSWMGSPAKLASIEMDLQWDTILGVQHSYVGISLLDAVRMSFIDFERCPYGRLQTLQLFQIIDNGRTGLVRVRY